MPLEHVQNEIRRRISPVSDTPHLDSQVLLAYVLGKSRTWVLAHPEVNLTLDQKNTLESALTRMEKGEPLPYLLGRWEFYGLNFCVAPPVLIPRPETELLVEHAIKWLHKHPNRRFAVDVGTGSGCIAVVMAVHISDLSVIASDISYPALNIARTNVRRHGVANRVYCIQYDLIPRSHRRFDLICANLPYIPTQTLRSINIYGKEPDLALDGGSKGLDLIHKLIQDAPHHLAGGGLLLLEIEASQGAAVIDIAQEFLMSSDIHVLPDLSGKDRLVYIELSN